MNTESNSAYIAVKGNSEPAPNLLTSKEYLAAQGNLLVPIGLTEKGEAIVRDIDAIPHLLVCGASGTGKTSFVQTILATLISRYSDNEVQFAIMDTKGVDYSVFSALPYLSIPVSTDNTVDTFSLFLSNEEKRRIRIFANLRCRDQSSYNRSCDNNGLEKMPALFVVIDDLSLVISNPDFKRTLTELLSTGRTLGIHIIAVTSIVSSKMITKELLSCFPYRISFCVSSKTDSRYILEQYGAERLPVPGEIYFKEPAAIIQCKCAYASFTDIQTMISEISPRHSCDYNYLASLAESFLGVDRNKSSENEEKASVIEEYDSLLPEVAEYILSSGKASIGNIQRVFKLGFSRASRLMDQLAKLGVVGQDNGGKERAILTTMEKWKASGIEKSIMPVQKTTQTNTANNTPLRKPIIPLRDFPLFSVGEYTMEVSENCIRIGFPTQTAYGKAITTASFDGPGITKLVYKAPRLFSKGLLQFYLKPTVNMKNNAPDLFIVQKDDLSQYLRVEFDKSASEITKRFMQQIAEDLHMEVSTK
ncbi:MAG: DNA translocase FtsK [Lachnospiraceae bacterium]|nr:DNA translocase FtsK [Lachnospiraceae bacterium]